MDTKYESPVILFDGFCNLCTAVVQFVIKRDPSKKFRFASLQSEFGVSVAKKYGLSVNYNQSFILLEDQKIYLRSTAALKLSKSLSGGWPLLYALIIVPKFIRDVVYDFIAQNRYRWFGKKTTCWIPSNEKIDVNLFIHHLP